jgi:hypothetical protein
MENSFIESETENNLEISTWYDLNSQSAIKNNAAQSTQTNKPKYIENALNGLPVIRFDGVDNFMTFNGTNLSGSNYTIFVIEQRRGNTTSINHFIAGSTSSTNNNLHLGYDSDTTLRFGHYSNDLDYTVSAYSIPTPKMHSFRFSKTEGKSYWENGGVNPDASSSGQTTALTSNSGAALGRAAFSSTYYFNGDIAEVIIFLRALKKEERQSIESYLSKKWGIKIS